MAASDTTRYGDLCRLCGIKTGEIVGINIFADEGILRQVYKKIEICLPVQVEPLTFWFKYFIQIQLYLQIHESDELPKMICKQCLLKLDFFVDFREKSLRTENLLIDLYKELTNAGIHNDQMKMNIVFDHPEYIMVQHHLINDSIESVSEVDLNQLEHRENMVIEHQIILGPQPVEINSHSLDNIDLTHADLTSQDVSNHSLQTEETMLVDENNTSHVIQTSRYSSTNLELINQDQLHAYTTETYTLNDVTLNSEGIQDKVKLLLIIFVFV